MSFDWVITAVLDAAALFQVKSCLFLFYHGDNTVVNQGFKQDILEGSMVIANKDVAQVQKYNLR